jgi:hypothetical protein|tara:strand:+ start:111 stop:857 length:747 start_codon:yes stop_codon:yes gene_type:complete
MATNFFFNNFESSQEQLLIEDLSIEAIKIHGIDVMYLPKTYGDYDYLYGEDDLGFFNSFHECEMYINSTDGFGGEGDFMGKFGFEMRDQMTMSVARFSFEKNVGNPAALPRPREGDMLYFPLTKGLFTIQFVEHEPVFYQMGALQFFELRTEKFEYSGERLNTGIAEVDKLEDKKSFDVGHESQWFMEGLSNTLAPIHDETGERLLLEGYTELVLDDIAHSENTFIETNADNFIDFTDQDPFSEGGTF